MATSLHPHSSNPFRDPNRTPAVTPQATGTSTTSLNPFLHPAETVTPQATGTSQYFTPQPTGTLSPQATGAHSTAAPIETQSTGSYYTPTSSNLGPNLLRPSSTIPDSDYKRGATASLYPAADVRHGEIPLETGPRRAYAPDWHPDGRTWRNEHVPAPTSPSPPATRTETQWDSLASTWRRPSASASSPNLATQQTGSNSSWSEYPGLARHGTTVRPPPRHPSQPLERANTAVGTGSSRVGPGPPTTTPTPGRALLHNGKVLAYPAQYECNKCHLTGYVAYDPSNPCRECWSLFAQPYEGVLSFAPWDSPESVTSDEQNLQRPLPSSSSPRTQSRPQRPLASSSRPVSHPQHSSYGPGQPLGSLPPAGWSSSSSLRPSATLSYGRPPRGALVVRPGDPRIGGRVCWKCSGDGWQYKTMGLETKTCSACNGLGRLF
ncbi:hypothetical protein RHS01_03553 [Rhizoctonia solani]|uniref:Uncharacterized protein n=1 Tax=Rhizoctonia solani TaxID=456999 RepID=A0A8H7M8G5_9AGAM|nr:hypothetical protein RHS01_03553 [Rhizoctonia solani]